MLYYNYTAKSLLQNKISVLGWRVGEGVGGLRKMLGSFNAFLVNYHYYTVFHSIQICVSELPFGFHSAYFIPALRLLPSAA